MDRSYREVWLVTLCFLGAVIRLQTGKKCTIFENVLVDMQSHLLKHLRKTDLSNLPYMWKKRGSKFSLCLLQQISDKTVNYKTIICLWGDLQTKFEAMKINSKNILGNISSLSPQMHSIYWALNVNEIYHYAGCVLVLWYCCFFSIIHNSDISHN